MNLESIIGLIAAFLLMIYLGYALLRPEKFYRLTRGKDEWKSVFSLSIHLISRPAAYIIKK